jgi:ACS family D-galactonate transporter-like MFS transporter
MPATSAPAEDRQLLRFAPPLILICICVLINYVDRGNLSVAAPALKIEFGLSASQLGVLFAAFFTTYTAMQFVIGWLVDRFDPAPILAAGFLVWSLATAATGIARVFSVLLAMRLILGVGEAVALPCGSKIIAQHLTDRHRGFAAGALMASLRAGNAVGTFGAGLLMARYGWRPVFIGIGLLSLIWLPAWYQWKPSDPRARQTEHPNDRPEEDQIVSQAAALSALPSFAQIYRQRSFWGTALGQFCCNYLLYFMVTWLPSYLVMERHLTTASMAKVAGSYYLMDAVSAIGTGWLQDHFIRGGFTPTLIRKLFMSLGFVIAIAGLLGCALSGANSYLPWLLVAGIGCGATSPGIFAFPQRIAGQHVVGKWYGSQNGISNLAGVVAPALTGFVLQRTGSFIAPFAITSILCLLGILLWSFLVGRVEPIDWSGRSHALPTPSPAR